MSRLPRTGRPLETMAGASSIASIVLIGPPYEALAGVRDRMTLSILEANGGRVPNYRSHGRDDGRWGLPAIH